MRKHRLIVTLSLLLIAAFFGILIVLINQTQKSQELRQKAATPTGTEQLTLSPTGKIFIKGEHASITLTGTLNSIPLDGVQTVITITSTLPADFSFTLASIPGLSPARNMMTAIESGKRLELAFVTSDAKTPYVHQGTQILGTFTFTAPASGMLTFSYNTTLTKISKNQTAQDIAAIPKEEIYTFVTPTPTPWPTPTPMSAPCKGPNGSKCSIKVCPVCTSPQCQKNPCKFFDGICRNGVCKRKIIPKYSNDSS